MNLLGRIKTIKNKEYIIICIILFLIVFMALFSSILKESYAFYQDSNSVSILSSKVGDFSGKGDTSPLDRPTDVNVIYYIQDLFDQKKYDIYDTLPVNLQNNYVLDEKKSNCIPTNATYTKDSRRDYSIQSDGTVTINVSETIPNQIVCRIYYSFNLVKYDEKDGDIKIIMYVQSDDGEIVTIRENKSYIVGDTVPTNYTMSYYECNNQNNIKTEINYDQTNGFTFTTTGKNICHAYFDRP